MKINSIKVDMVIDDMKWATYTQRTIFLRMRFNLNSLDILLETRSI